MNIPIAEQWVNQQFEKQRITTNGNDDVYCSRQGIIEACQIFAKLHVKAALKAASETRVSGSYSSTLYERDGDDKNKIKNSYPLSNIK